MPLSIRSPTCASRSAPDDRDIGATNNLRYLASSESIVYPVTAGGVEGAGAGPAPDVKPSAAKQEWTLINKDKIHESSCNAR